MSTRITQSDGLDFERRFMAMVDRFSGAERGVDGNDVFAALLLEENNDPRLKHLLQRQIRTVGEVDEDSILEDLKFEGGE